MENNQIPRVSIKAVLPIGGSDNYNDACVLLANGKSLDCDVLGINHDGFVWYVDAKIKACYGVINKDSNSPAISKICMGESGKLQGTQLHLTDDTYLCLVQNIEVVTGGVIAKIRIMNDEQK